LQQTHEDDEVITNNLGNSNTGRKPATLQRNCVQPSWYVALITHPSLCFVGHL
jgi:hypothetical protein